MTEREVQWDLPPDPEAVGKGREMTRDVLHSWGLGDLVGEVLIIISELCTNAIRHGGSPASLSLRAAGRCVGGEVADSGAPFVPRPREPSDQDEHGRGLMLVAAFADRWGVEPAAGGGKVVWFQRCL